METRSKELEALFERVRQGDEEALGQLTERYTGMLRRIARNLLGEALRPALDSMDLVQSVHRTLLLGLRSGRFDISSPEKFLALAVTLLRRKAARQWRRQKLRPRLSLDVGPDSSVKLLSALSSSRDDPAAALQLQDTVEQVLSQLDPTDRRLLELRLDGCSTAEAARELGIEAHYLRVRLGRLRDRLRDAGLLHGWL